MFSRISLFICILIIILGLFYKPRWKQENAHATISYDVSGYYIYLPATFIYKDLKKVSFKEKIHQEYKNSSHTYQTHTYTNGNEVAQYSCGMAVQYLPFFLIADAVAEPLGYKRDGFSIPYQAAIHWGSALIAFLGLFYLRKCLLEYFSDKATAITLFLLVLGTNYLNYVTMDAAMTHNYLFTITALLIWNTILFYKNTTFFRAGIIGVLIGLAALTRPTEILLVFIPILWGVNLFFKDKKNTSIKNRFSYLIAEYPKLLLSILICGLIGSLQLIYWKYVGDHWFIYSYGSEFGFDWFEPHIVDGLFSYKKGWLVYTPMMAIPILGLGMMLFKKHELSGLITIYFLITIYIAFAWSVWWYGGSLGQRAMVQTYALLVFPFAFFIEYILKNKIRFIPFFIVVSIFCYYNIWLHHQAHLGGMLDPENMTRKYYWKILGKWKKNKDDQKFLDTNEEFTGVRKNIKRIYFNDFEKDTIIQKCDLQVINGLNSYCIQPKNGLNGFFNSSINNQNGKWLRAGGVFRQKDKEWGTWIMPQFIVYFKNGDKVIKDRLLRIPRLLDHAETRDLYIDVEIPEEEFTNVEIVFWSDAARFPILVDDLYMEVFD